MTPVERLIHHEQLIDLILVHQYVPHKSQENYNAVLGALRELNPGANYCPECSGGLMDIANQAKAFINRFRQEKVDELKFMTFPGHDKTPTEHAAISESIPVVLHPHLSVTPDVDPIKPKRTMSPEHKEKIRLAKLAKKGQ